MGQHFAGDFYIFKLKGYNIQLQVVVDHWRWFCDVFLGIPNYANDTATFTYCNFPLCIVKPLMETWLLLIVEKQEFDHTSLAIRGIPFCFGWWCPTSKLARDILFMKLFSTDNCFMVEVWWTFLRSWKRCSENWCWK